MGKQSAPPDFNDPFQPPSSAREVHCLHCGIRYTSAFIRWDPVRTLWACPVIDCTGAGYGFDIFDYEAGSTSVEAATRSMLRPDLLQ
jgi:hypothetical protein